MSTSSTPSTTTGVPPNDPNLFSLVVQSKKAFQHGEQICFHAHEQSNASAQAALDVLALDAKVRWVRDAVLEQLKLAASVAKSIEEKRTYIGRQVQEWDTSRAQHTNSLDAILEALSNQLVPPEFHQSSTDSSIFGSQHSDSDSEDIFTETRNENENGHQRRQSLESQTKDVSVSPQLESPSATLRLRNQHRNVSTKKENDTAEEKGRRKKQDRTRWKTLRDFVDDQTLEGLLETIETDRAKLDKVLSKTSDYPESLHTTISSIQSSLPETESSSLILQRVQNVLVDQQEIANEMAKSLESLSAHYDQMMSALDDHDAGEIFSEDDMQDMNRDTDELPFIMAELEENARRIEGQLNHLLSLKETHTSAVKTLGMTLSDLDELGSIMEDMLDEQESTEKDAEESFNTLHAHLEHLKEFHQHYVGFQIAFSKLIVEMARRLQYREGMDEIVRRMTIQLEDMRDEEAHCRAEFNVEYGQLLPEDICLSISNPPTRWQIIPWEGENREVLPDIEPDLVTLAKEHLGIDDQHPGTESL